MIFELDCKTIVDRISSNHHDCSEFETIIANCRHILYQFPHFRVEFVKRQANVVAQALARVAIVNVSHYFYHCISACVSNFIPNEMR